MIIAYDHEARSRQTFIEEAKQKEAAEKLRVAEQVEKLAAELKAHKKSSHQLSVHLGRVEREKRMREEEIAKLKTLDEFRVRDLEDAVAVAKRDAVAEVRTQMGRAYELFSSMMKKPVERARYLAQAEANLQLLDDLANPEEPCDPAVERASLVENMEGLKDAHTVFDGMADELKKILGKDYLAPTNVKDLVASPRVETLAESVGIYVASGSNDGSMGLRLRAASEDLEESDSDDNEETAAPEQVVPPEQVVQPESRREPTPLDPPREPTPPVQDLEPGEVATSTGGAAAPVVDKV